jgi:transcriptional regulator with XRE-family HTH domain
LPAPAAVISALTPIFGDAYDFLGMPVSAEEQSPSLSFGECLRRERELRRISLRDVSEATKINIRYLEALERNEFTFLPAGAFTRGFIRSYARFIGADENEMVNAYLYELGRQERQKKIAPGRDPLPGLLGQGRQGATERRRRIWPWVLAAAVALLAIAALVIGPRLLRGRPAARLEPPAAVVGAPARG